MFYPYTKYEIVPWILDIPETISPTVIVTSVLAEFPENKKILSLIRPEEATNDADWAAPPPTL